MATLLEPDIIPAWIAGLFETRHRSIFAGINDDDCAILGWRSPYLVLTLDFLNADPIASELGIGDMRDLGRLLVASNLADLCGSGARPVALLVGLTLPHGTRLSDFQKLYRGIKFEAERHLVPVIGGDTKLGKSRAVMAVAIGSAKSAENLFLKGGAKPGDVIWVSGELGCTAAAAWGYRNAGLGRSWRSWARRTILVPHVPLRMSQLVSAAKFGHGGTDISDGLGADMRMICEASRVGAIIEAGRIPTALQVVRAAAIAGVAPWNFAFASGGDFQFIVTTEQAVRQAMKRFGFVEIGEVTRRRRLVLRMPEGRVVPLPVRGHRDRSNFTFAQEIDALIRNEL